MPHTTRYGRTYNNSYSCADMIWYTYDGNRLVKAYNSMKEPAYYGAISTGFDVQPYKYNGKELDRTNGYDMMDYGARMYATDLGRWMVMDPLADNYGIFNNKFRWAY